MGVDRIPAMAPSPDRRGPASARGRITANQRSAGGDPSERGDRAARSLRALAEEAERGRSRPDEQQRLLRRAAGGDAAAEQTLFHENLAMVLRLAHDSVHADGSGLTEDELLQEGSLGLISAIKGFPESGREDFRAYAEEQARAAVEGAQAGAAQLARDKEQLV